MEKCAQNVESETSYQKTWSLLKKLPFDDNTIFELIIPFLYPSCTPEHWWANDNTIAPWMFDSFQHDGEPIYEIGLHTTLDLLCFAKVSTQRFSDAITIYIDETITEEWFIHILESAKMSNQEINNLEIVHQSNCVNFGNEVSFSTIQKYLPKIKLQ